MEQARGGPKVYINTPGTSNGFLKDLLQFCFVEVVKATHTSINSLTLLKNPATCACTNLSIVPGMLRVRQTQVLVSSKRCQKQGCLLTTGTVAVVEKECQSPYLFLFAYRLRPSSRVTPVPQRYWLADCLYLTSSAEYGKPASQSASLQRISKKSMA